MQRAQLRLAELLQGRRARRLTAPIVHVVSPPNLHELYRFAETFASTGEEAATALQGERADPALVEEFEGVHTALERRVAEVELVFPDFFASGRDTLLLLYVLVRTRRPDTVLEVGVADGTSSFVLLAALNRNDHGRLVSVDVDPRAGVIAAEDPRWDRRIHTPESADRQLAALAAEIGPVDVFYHDALHQYAPQTRDLYAVLPVMAPGGVVVVDDINWSHAFMDLCRRFEFPAVVLGERRKAAGAFTLP